MTSSEYPPGPADSSSGYEHPALDSASRSKCLSAAKLILRKARIAEPRVSVAVTSIVEAYGGEIARYDSRFKTVVSLARKTQDVLAEFGGSPLEAGMTIKDVLRYTAVIPDEDYWTRGTQIRDALVAAGFEQRSPCQGWRRDYSGRNEFFFTAGRTRFEVQIHTAGSLVVAEGTHRLYEASRMVTTPTEVREVAKAALIAAFAAVPAPDDIHWVD
jgi:hypothetical protein